MRSIFITAEAYGAIKARLLDPTPPPPRGPDGTHPIWLDPKFVDQLDQMRAGAGETIVTLFCGWRRRAEAHDGRARPLSPPHLWQESYRPTTNCPLRRWHMAPVWQTA
jgi:hypothetical protein